MDKFERYKKLYPSENMDNKLLVNSNGKIDLPKWLMHLIIHTSGLKSRKKRILKKVLKKQLIKLLLNSN